MTISRRHHYIPRFLIDNFTDIDNKVWVYNKEEGKMLKNKQSSKSIFFEMDRNNFDVNGKTIDNIELMYSEVDNLLSKNLDKVLSTHTMTGRELTLLILLVTLTKWRIPDSDEKFIKNYKDIPIEQLGLKIGPIDRGMKANAEDIKRIKEMEIVKEVKRLLLSVQPLIREDNLEEIHKNCFIVSDDEFPSLLGDVPIIENPNNTYETLEDFIFPLSNNETLICKRGAEKYVSQKIFHIQKDLTTFHLANKYVICKSKEQLLKIVDIYSTLLTEKKTHLLTKYVFEFIK
jgi:hypothetical protein